MNHDEGESPALLAGVVDPEGAAAAHANRTPDCSHPPPAECSYLNCAFCGVWMLDGKVLDCGLPRKSPSDAPT